MKRLALATIAVFIAWSVLDFLIHGVLLQSAYAATAELWRPMAQIKVGLMYLVSLVSAGAFAGLYTATVRPKTVASGLVYGLLFGIATGVPMGFGTYCVMAIPLHLAVGWFIGTVVEATAGGAIVGAIVRPPIE